MDQHFDPERLAAFADGSLSAAERAAAEAHAADCAQCLQLLAAMARTHEEARPSPRLWRLPVFVRWAAPFAAAVTGVAVWFNMFREPSQERVPTEQTKVSAQRSTADEAQLKDQSQAPPQVADARTEDQKGGQRVAANEGKASSPKDREESRDTFSRVDEQVEAAKPYAEFSTRREAAKHAPETPPVPARSERSSVAAAVPSPAPPSPAPSQPSLAGATAAAEPAAVAEAARDRAGDDLSNATAEQRRFGITTSIEASSPERRYRWRVNGVIAERSTDGGATWASLPGIPGPQLLAIASPGPSVAWFVGRAGTVFLFSDGTSTRLTFPEAVDLTGVRAVSGSDAQVTTQDGRVFRTVDGGQTWSLQETPPAAF